MSSLASLLARRPATVLLLLWLPLVKWGLPPVPLRLLLFYGGGCALAAVAVSREGDAPRIRPVFSGIWRGVGLAVACYAALMAGAAFILYVPLATGWMPEPLRLVSGSLASLFDPAAFIGADDPGKPPASPLPVLGSMLGAVLEEALFRVALFWRWGTAHAGPDGRLPPLGTVLRLIAVSAYFAALHWPQVPTMIVVAFLGALVAGAALWRWRSFALVAMLHALFNAHQWL